MEDPWSIDAQTAAGPGLNGPRGAGRTGVMARFAPRWFLPLAVMGAILGILLLSWQQSAAADTKPTLKFSYYSSEVEESTESEENTQRHLYININPPLEEESSALLVVLNESEVQETLAGDTRAADMGYTGAGYAQRNVDYSVPASVELPAEAGSVALQFTIIDDEIVEGEEIFILKLVEYDGSPYTVDSDDSYNKTRVLVVDDEAPVLPDNLSVTLSRGAKQTDAGLSSKVTIKGDCPPAGGLKVQMKRADESWAVEARNGSNVWPGSAADNSDYSLNEIKDCDGETGEISVDGIAPGEAWDVRTYVWQPDTPNAISVAAASEFSHVYRVVGWGVPSLAEGVTLTPGVERLGATWTPGAAVGTDVTVTSHIRWRTQQVGLLGQPDYVAAGAWNAEDGVPTDTSASHAITGLTGGKFYEVQVRSVSPVGHSAWSPISTAPTYSAAAPSDDPPTGLVVAQGNARLVAGWKPPEDIDEAEPDAYAVWYKTSAAPDRQAPLQDDPETGWVTVNVDGGTTDTEITGLSNGVSHDVRVRAQYLSEESSSGMADGPWSATASATPHEDAVWAAILTVSKDLGVFFYGCGSTGPYMTRCNEALTDHDFEFDGVTYRWLEIKDGQPDEHLGPNSVQPFPYPSAYFYPAIGADSPLRNGRMQFGSVMASLGDADMVNWSPGGQSFSLTTDDASIRHQGWAVGQRVPLSLQAKRAVTLPNAPIPPGDDSNNEDTPAAPSGGGDDNAVTLPDNISITVSKGSLATSTGISTKFTIGGDCPPNGGGFRFQMARAGIQWPGDDTDLSLSYWPEDVPGSDDHFEVLELRECGLPDWPVTSQITVDVISPGEKWEVRVYVWRQGEASDFSPTYYVIGWSVPDAPTGLSVTPGQEQLAVEWDGIVAAGTDMPVTTHIRWRTAQAGQPGETGYAAAGSWNNDDGATTDGPVSHTITGLDAGASYDVEVRAASPMGSSEWVRAEGETLPPSGDDDTPKSAAQVSVPVVAFEHEKTGEGQYRVSVDEGDQLTVTLTFTPALSRDTSIRWYTASHHEEGANRAEWYGDGESEWLRQRNDYVYSNRPETRNIALTADMTSATFTIKSVEDSEAEGDETFLVQLCGPPPRCEWPFPPPEPHPSRQGIMEQLEATKYDYQDVANTPELLVTIVDDDGETIVDDDESEN